MFFLRNESEKHKGGGGGRIIINKDSSARIDSATNINTKVGVQLLPFSNKYYKN